MLTMLLINKPEMVLFKREYSNCRASRTAFAHGASRYNCLTLHIETILVHTPFESHFTHDNEFEKLQGILAYCELCEVAFFFLIDFYDKEQVLESLLPSPEINLFQTFYHLKDDQN